MLLRGLRADPAVVAAGREDIGGAASEATPSADAPINSIVGTSGDDTLIGGRSSDRLEGGDGDDLLLGRQGDDGFEGGAGNDTINGGGGEDAVGFTAAAAGVRVDLSLHDAQDTGVGFDVIRNVEDIGGSAFADVLAGDAGLNLIAGGDGADTVLGRGGSDHLFGGAGDNLVSGGRGDDFLDGEGGDDLLLGGDGNDFLQDHGGDSTLRGGSGADAFLLPDSGLAHVFGDDGDDHMVLGDGGEAFGGGGGDDILVSNGLGSGGGGDDHLKGPSTLLGGGGDDRLDEGLVMRGGGGGDRLTDVGQSKLWGGDGADTFVFLGFLSGGVIVDLDPADAIDLSALEQSAALHLASAFSGQAGEVVLSYDRAARLTAVEVDRDGDGESDWQMTIHGDHRDFTNFVF